MSPSAIRALVCCVALVMSLGCGTKAPADGADRKESETMTSPSEEKPAEEPAAREVVTADLSGVDEARVKAVVEAQSWKIVGEPLMMDTGEVKSATFNLLGSATGAVILYTYQDEAAAKESAAGMPEAYVVRRDGSRLLVVSVPLDRGAAEELAGALIKG